MVENLFDCSGDDTSLVVLVKTFHRICFTCTGLPVRKYGSVVALQGTVHDRPCRRVVHFFLRGILAVDGIKCKTMGGIWTVAVGGVAVFVRGVDVLTDRDGTLVTRHFDYVLKRFVSLQLAGQWWAYPYHHLEVGPLRSVRTSIRLTTTSLCIVRG